MAFVDHFGAVSSQYAEFRPSYPEQLFAWLAEVAPGRRLAWDCATGTGQAAHGLAPHFDRVVATDASLGQIARARPGPGVEFYVADAAASGLAPGSVDLVTVAQALHWLDLPAFYREADRVLAPEGVIAVWTYTRLLCPLPRAQAAIERYYHETVGPYWPPERRHVEAGYRDLDFPWPEIPTPPFQLATELSLEGLIGYLRSWSATSRYIASHGVDPTEPLAETLAAEWTDTVPVAWPLVLRAGRNPD
jgi:SAM-dependent methyltransferase